jgi:hypothetical protein
MDNKRIPPFESDEQAAEFWDTHDFAEYADDTVPVPDVVFPKQITLRRPPEMTERDPE